MWEKISLRENGQAHTEIHKTNQKPLADRPASPNAVRNIKHLNKIPKHHGHDSNHFQGRRNDWLFFGHANANRNSVIFLCYRMGHVPSNQDRTRRRKSIPALSLWTKTNAHEIQSLEDDIFSWSTHLYCFLSFNIKKLNYGIDLWTEMGLLRNLYKMKQKFDRKQILSK